IERVVFDEPMVEEALPEAGFGPRPGDARGFRRIIHAERTSATRMPPGNTSIPRAPRAKWTRYERDHAPHWQNRARGGQRDTRAEGWHVRVARVRAGRAGRSTGVSGGGSTVRLVVPRIAAPGSA